MLTASGVRVNGAHPFMDPGGYRAHMIFELAQSHYKVPGLYNSLLQHYQVNVADPSSATPAPVLGKDFNFQFTYEHTAAAAAKRDSSYRYASLPAEIDLSSAKPDLYPSGVTIPGLGIQGSMASVTIPASQVAWGLTIPRNSRNREQRDRISRKSPWSGRPRRADGERSATDAAGPRVSLRLPAPSARVAGRDDGQLELRRKWECPQKVNRKKGTTCWLGSLCRGSSTLYLSGTAPQLS